MKPMRRPDLWLSLPIPAMAALNFCHGPGAGGFSFCKALRALCVSLAVTRISSKRCWANAMRSASLTPSSDAWGFIFTVANFVFNRSKFASAVRILSPSFSSSASVVSKRVSPGPILFATLTPCKKDSCSNRSIILASLASVFSTADCIVVKLLGAVSTLLRARSFSSRAITATSCF